MAYFTERQFLIICLLESPPKSKKRRVESEEEIEDDTPSDPGQFGLLLSYFLWPDFVEPRRVSRKPPSDDSRSSKSTPQSPKSRGKRKEVVPASPKVTQTEDDDEAKSSSSEDEGGEVELVEEEEVGRMLVSSAATKRFYFACLWLKGSFSNIIVSAQAALMKRDDVDIEGGWKVGEP